MIFHTFLPSIDHKFHTVAKTINIIFKSISRHYTDYALMGCTALCKRYLLSGNNCIVVETSRFIFIVVLLEVQLIYDYCTDNISEGVILAHFYEK